MSKVSGSAGPSKKEKAVAGKDQEPKKDKKKEKETKGEEPDPKKEKVPKKDERPKNDDVAKHVSAYQAYNPYNKKK